MSKIVTGHADLLSNLYLRIEQNISGQDVLVKYTVAYILSCIVNVCFGNLFKIVPF